MSYEERVRLHKIAIDAAKESGVKRIVYTSLAFGGPPNRKERSVSMVQWAHIDTEEYLKTCGLEYIVIREGVYMEAWHYFAGFLDIERVKEEGKAVCVIPNDGKVAYAHRDELGEASAPLLENAGKYVNQVVLLAGPKSYNTRETLQLLCDTLGLPQSAIEIREVGLDSYVDYHTSSDKGYTSEPSFLRFWGTSFEGLRKGEVADTDDGIFQDLLGRRPRALEDVVGEVFFASYK
jgi:uncharacterized protein YbjT (DUF2867 family)